MGMITRKEGRKLMRIEDRGLGVRDWLFLNFHLSPLQRLIALKFVIRCKNIYMIYPNLAEEISTPECHFKDFLAKLILNLLHSNQLLLVMFVVYYVNCQVAKLPV